MSPQVSSQVDTPASSSTPWSAATLFAASMLVLAALGPSRAQVAPALPFWTLAFGALLWLWHRHPAWLGRPGVLLGGAVFLRLLFLLPIQDLSDDLVRYVWDGWLGVQGVRPYPLVPSDPALERFQANELFGKLNSPDYHSVYPPLSQWVFLLGGRVHEAVGWPASGRAIRGAMVLLELLGLLALVRARRVAGGRTPAGSLEGRTLSAALVLYAWNPLVVLAVAGSGHSEGGLVLGIGLLLWGIAAGRPATAWCGLALGVLAKGIPLLLVPLVGRALLHRAGLRATLLGLVPAGVLAGVLSVPFFALDTLAHDLAAVRQSTRLYVELFEFNAGLHALMVEGVRRIGWLDLRPWLGPGLQAVALAGALWIGLRHPVGSLAQTARGALLVLSLYLVTATTVHPWYLLWVLPFLPFTHTGRWPWMWGAWAAFPTYLVYTGTPAAPLAVLFWGGMLAVALLPLANRRREVVLRPLRRRMAPRKARWMAPWVQGARVADVGGGEGEVGRCVAELRSVALPSGSGARAPALVLVDPDPGESSPGTRSVRGVAEQLPLADDSVDTVLLSFVLHHTADPDRALAEALRVARRRVVILESTWRWEVERRLLACLDRWVNGERGQGLMGSWDAPLHHRRPEAWIHAAEARGARVVRADHPGPALHRVLRLVLEPRLSAPPSAPPSERAAQAPEKLRSETGQ